MTIHSVLYCLSFAAVVTSAGRMGGVTSRRWFPSLICAALLACMPTMPGAFANDNKPDKKELKAQAEALLAKSRDLSDIEAPGSPPFVLNAKIHYQIGTQSADGQGQIIWLAPDHYREAYTAPNYSYTEIVRDGHRYFSRTNNEMPLMMYEVQRTMQRAMSAGLKQKEKIKRADPAPIGSEARICVTFTDELALRRCFDDDGDVAAMERHSPGDGILGERYQFSDFAGFGTKRFPKGIVFRGGDGHVIEIDTQDLAPVKEVAADAFDVPADATKEPWCAGPKAADADLPRAPFSPAIDLGPMLNAIQSIGAANVALYLEIAANGHVRAGSVIHSPKPIKDEYLKTWLKEMRFPPLRCGNEGIEYQTELQLGR